MKLSDWIKYEGESRFFYKETVHSVIYKESSDVINIHSQKKIDWPNVAAYRIVIESDYDACEKYGCIDPGDQLDGWYDAICAKAAE